jgi:hypothetical protein
MELPSSAKRSVDNTVQRLSQPFNLTAAAESMLWSGASHTVGVSGPSETVALEVRGLNSAENGRQNDGSQDIVYVVFAGFGVLRSDDLDLECTAGDVLFVPQGCSHRFERMDGEIRIWRISSVTR